MVMPIEGPDIKAAVHPDSAALVDLAASMRDRGKQPAEILETLLEFYAEEPPETATGWHGHTVTDDPVQVVHRGDAGDCARRNGFPVRVEVSA
jgi:hypothetical protein